MSVDTSRRNPGHLFAEGRLYEFLTERHQDMLKEIDAFSTDYVLNASVDDVVDYLAGKYRLEPITLSETPEIVAPREIEMDVRGTSVCLAAPFDGNADIFDLCPSTHGTISPRGRIVGNELRIEILRLDHDAAAMRRQFDENISNIRNYLRSAGEEITAFNDQLPSHARQRLESRKTKLLADKGMLSALGFPIRQRAAVPGTHSVRRKELVIAKPVVPSSPFQPEPALEMAHYEHILSVISNMVLVIERSPSSFARMSEDGLHPHSRSTQRSL